MYVLRYFYVSEPPPNRCLYDMEYDSKPSGGEVKRDQEHIETIPKAVNFYLILKNL